LPALARFGPPLLLMVVIFGLSSIHQLNTDLGVGDLILRKLGHVTEYGLLFWLWFRALGFERPWLAAVIAIAYSATDEYHQTFVDGRHGTPVDNLIDATGVGLTWALLRARASRARWP
jgi:VanZ family protein